MQNKRLNYAIIFIILLVIEVLIAKFVHDRIIRPYIGDMLVVILLYCLVRVFCPDKPKWLSLYIFIFAAALEMLQYVQIVELLGLAKYPLARIIIGTTFDLNDIICYAAGCLIVSGLERIIRRKHQVS